MKPPAQFLLAPPRTPLVAPSILSADFARLADDCAHALRVGGDLLHLDVMDGHFVPNLTFGPALCASLRRALPDAFLDVHLMVSAPAMFFEPFAKAGANHVTFHVEVTPPEKIETLCKSARALGMTAGLAINPPTLVDRILPHLGHADLILVMSVNPGFSGQAFIPSALEKARAITPLLRADQRLQMDGGITTGNARAVREAGVDVIVAASAIFGVKPEKRARVIEQLRS